MKKFGNHITDILNSKKLSNRHTFMDRPDRYCTYLNVPNNCEKDHLCILGLLSFSLEVAKIMGT